MTFGKQVRRNRIFHTPTGRILTLAVDQGSAYRFDLPAPLAAIAETVRRFEGEPPDAIVAQRGLFGEILRPFAGRIPLMLQAVTITPDRSDESYLISNVEDALALGADALAVTIFVGGRTQKEGLGMLGRLVREARGVGLPVVAHIYPLGEEFRGKPTSERGVAYAARAGFEVGVDVVKTRYTGDPESFQRIVDRTPIPIVAAGGPRLGSPLAVLEMARDVALTGARGMTIGRNLWGDRHPPALLGALKAVYHEGRSPAEALEAYEAGHP